MNAKETILAVISVALLADVNAARPQKSAPTSRYTTWSAYGGTPDQIRYSTLGQINRANVKQLQVAWSYDTGEPGGLQTQPIVVDDLLYGNSATSKVFAVRAATGERVWT